jgi:protease-4
MLIFLCALNPFYDANFSALPSRSVSVFSNPAGLGLQPGSEVLCTYHPDVIMPAITASHIGFGLMKTDSTTNYEIGAGYKLPGVFAIGYARQWGDTSSHVLGCIGRMNQHLSIGYRTTVGSTMHMFGGIGLRPYEQYLTLSADVEYEGIESIRNFYYGAVVQPVAGVKLNFHAAHIDTDFHWNTGLELSFGRIKVAGAYSSGDKKFSAGIILSSEQYATFLPPSKKLSRLQLKETYAEIEQRRFLGIPVGTRQGFTRLLADMHSLIRRDDIEVILIDMETHAPSAAQSEELRAVLTALRDSGKHLVFYADNYHGTIAYELACAADEIIMAPSGSVFIPGLALRRYYVKNTFEKIGLETDVVHVGKYKSAIETLTRIDMSDADREQNEQLLDDIYYPAVANIARARGKTTQQVEELIDGTAYFNSDAASALGLVDTLLYDFELADYLVDTYGPLEMVDITNGITHSIIDETWCTQKPKIALVIAEGMIVTGTGEQSLLETRLIGSDTFTRVLEKLREDKSIKAVILRIDSGGGDALATEKMTRAVQRCVENKPVIVSMGRAAGSGGYHIACPADVIYGDKCTITGSIGVFHVNLVTAGLYEKLGITWDYVKKGTHSDALWGLRHMTDDELEREHREVMWWYDRFVTTVAQHRGMSVAAVDSLGQGRIYSGARAHELGLIDETGGFLDALSAAKELAQIDGDVEIVVYPQRIGFSLFGTTSRHSSIAYLMPDVEIQ